MSDLLHESPQVLRTLARVVGVHPATCYRWAFDGCLNRRGERVKLETIRIGGRIFSTESALRRYIEALSETPAKDPAPVRTVNQRTRASDRAGKELMKLGL